MAQQHTATEASMPVSSSPRLRRSTGSTSRRTSGKGGWTVSSTGQRGLTTGVPHSGQAWAEASSSTPQFTQ